MDAALDDLLVLDLSRVLAGPYATMILGDFGARVIKIERRGSGDDTRHWGPPFTESGESAYYLSVNRNKESMTLDLKQEAGQKILRQLAAQADVLVENFKVGTMERLGLGFETLRADNPGLVYCALTGYGQSGPYRQRPGYDTVIQAQGGLMSITGPADGQPAKVGVAIVDVTAGLYAAFSILAALHHRQLTGQGQFIDIALFDAQLGWLVNVASAYLVSGEAPGRFGNAHATIVPYQVFPAQDGSLMLAVGNDRQFGALCEVLGAPEWAQDERFATNPARVRNRELLVSYLSKPLSRRPVTEWMERLLAAGVPCGPVNTIPEALADPQTHAREMVQEIETTQGETVPLVGPVPKLSRTPAAIRRAPPALGEQTAQVLAELLAYDEAQIARLRAEEVV